MKMATWLASATLVIVGCSGGEPPAAAVDDYSSAGESVSDIDVADDDYDDDQRAPDSIEPQRAANPTNDNVMASARQPALPDGALRVRRVEIVDSTGFERPMVAATAMIPVGWQTQGGVVWKPSTCGNGYNVQWSATSPDGEQGINIFPGEKWSWNNYGGDSGGCPAVQITSIRQYLESLVERARPGARIIDFRERADIAKPFQQLNRVIPMSGGEVSNHVEAGEVLISYTAPNGTQIRESAAAVAVFSRTSLPGAMGRPIITLSGQSLPGFAAFAPDGHLDFTASESLRKSIKLSPEWDSRIAKHNAAMAKDRNESDRKISEINAQGARETMAIIAQTSRNISDSQQAARDQRSEQDDVMQRELGEWINDVETYADPNSVTGEVQLSHNYDNAWRLNDGTYVLTNDTNFDPYKTTGMNGEKLEQKK